MLFKQKPAALKRRLFTQISYFSTVNELHVVCDREYAGPFCFSPGILSSLSMSLAGSNWQIIFDHKSNGGVFERSPLTASPLMKPITHRMRKSSNDTACGHIRKLFSNRFGSMASRRWTHKPINICLSFVQLQLFIINDLQVLKWLCKWSTREYRR